MAENIPILIKMTICMLEACILKKQKILKLTDLKPGKVYFGSQFWRVRPWSVGLLLCPSPRRQHAMAEWYSGRTTHPTVVESKQTEGSQAPMSPIKSQPQ